MASLALVMALGSGAMAAPTPDPLPPAIAAGRWREAEALLQERLAATAPDARRREDYAKLGNIQEHAEEYDEAIASYERGEEIARRRPEPRPDPEGEAAHAAVRKALSTLYLRRAALRLLADDPAQAWADASRSLVADPGQAAAYFIEGKALVVMASRFSAEERIVSPQAVFALRRYLELVPDGRYADEARAMLRPAPRKP